MWPPRRVNACGASNISTHTSRVGCDDLFRQMLCSPAHFYSHIPCGMWRYLELAAMQEADFYSHIPCGMWRSVPLVFPNITADFYSHIPCGMWLALLDACKRDTKISTHTSRVGCDLSLRGLMTNRNLFLLTHPVWDVTADTLAMRRRIQFLLTHPVWDVTEHSATVTGLKNISTHTSRVGCDNTAANVVVNLIDFYSHIPCGMWPCRPWSLPSYKQFLLTHPVWDVTLTNIHLSVFIQFLLTHPVWDVTKTWNLGHGVYAFLLTHPVWDVTHAPAKLNGRMTFLLTHPVWDVTAKLLNI